MSLKLYNTLTRQKEEFKPLIEGRVNIYVCGPTVYGHSHIGHAKSYVSFDVIVRYLRYLGYKVLYVQNITDVGHLTDDADEGEDKIEKQSRKDRVHPMQIVEMYTKSYFEDMDALGVVRPDISPRATGHIIEQIELVKELTQKGYAYEVNGSVYFDVSKDKEYGKLSGRSINEAEAGTRVETRSDKRHPNDFALWKFAEPEHIMRWQSPWGAGFPGWHVECSAMSMKYLGETFDIHGGGMDNQFPHHECEIAQSECATEQPFVKYWIHNNLVTVSGQKMSKSLGNVILLKDAFKKYSPLVVRFFILQSHYRSTLDFSDEALEGAAKGLEKLLNTVHNLRTWLTNTSEQLDPARKASVTEYFMLFNEGLPAAMNDDFNTPIVVGYLFDLCRTINAQLAQDKPDINILDYANTLFTKFGSSILGIIPERIEEPSSISELDGQIMELIIRLRAEARARKLFSFSDKIRDGLAKLGIVLEDKKDGTTWHRSG